MDANIVGQKFDEKDITPLSKFLPYYNYQFPINNNLRWKPSRHYLNQVMKIIVGMRWEGRNITGGIFVEQAQPYSNDDRTSDKPQMREQFCKTAQQYSSKLSSWWKIQK